jgi:hypothetical protein
VVELVVIAKEDEIDEDGSTDITSIFTVLWKLGNYGHKSMTLAGAGDEYRDPQCRRKQAHKLEGEGSQEAGVDSPDTTLA